jgi:hypothetical protein
VTRSKSLAFRVQGRRSKIECYIANGLKIACLELLTIVIFAGSWRANQQQSQEPSSGRARTAQSHTPFLGGAADGNCFRGHSSIHTDHRSGDFEAVLIVSFVPDIALAVLHWFGGGWPEALALMVMHVAVWAICVTLLPALTMTGGGPDSATPSLPHNRYGKA